jgi:GTP-binding protein
VPMIDSYFENRENLYCTFILLDSRIDPQVKDMDFIRHLGSLGIPIAIVLTKTDKLKQSELGKSKNKIEMQLLKDWEELPPLFITSSEKKSGRTALLDFIENAIKTNR